MLRTQYVPPCFLLCISLGLFWKLADLGGLHSLSQEGVGPAATGGVSVGLVGSNRKVQTFLGSESALL